MKEMKTASTQGLLCRLKKALKGLESQCERRAALRRLKHYIALLENVQQMPIVDEAFLLGVRLRGVRIPIPQQAVG